MEKKKKKKKKKMPEPALRILYDADESRMPLN